jgi:cytochrome d ubiquinol oxidase subunit II
MAVLLDYETLRVLWWVLLGALLIGFAIIDGVDLGVAMLLPLVAGTDAERRALIDSMDPVWEGNQVWFVLGGCAAFAAWPALYATAFSGFYIAMFLVLVTLILRPVGFKFRNEVEDPRRRSAWDWALFVGGFVPALIFGVAVGNALQGVPFHFDEMHKTVYDVGFLGLLNPFALMTGVLAVVMLTMHGGVYLAVKTEGVLARRASRIAAGAAIVLVALFALAGLWAGFGVDGYRIIEGAAPDGPSNPLAKQVAVVPVEWFHNYITRPFALLGSALGLIAPIMAIGLLYLGMDGAAFVASSAAVAGVVAAPGLAMFPFILPSSTRPDHSLTVWDSSSSQSTLLIMLVATAVLMPIGIAFTTWAFRVRRGKLTEAEVEEGESPH